MTDEEKTTACQLAQSAGADFVKTSTGFGPGGATAHDVALMRRVVGPKMGVKAAGGIRTLEDAHKMIAAGATRLGASASVKIMAEAGWHDGDLPLLVTPVRCVGARDVRRLAHAEGVGTAQFIVIPPCPPGCAMSAGSSCSTNKSRSADAAARPDRRIAVWLQASAFKACLENLSE